MVCEVIQTKVGKMWICTRGVKARKCRFCGKAAIRLCDWEMKSGKTCDVAMCINCANAVDEDVDYCSKHFELYSRENMQGKLFDME